MTEKAFWVLERDGRYVTVCREPSPHGGTYIVPGWTDDIKDARHWPSYQYADMERRGLGHPFWMADPVEHAMIGADEYADGLAKEIGRLRAALEDIDARAHLHQTTDPAAWCDLLHRLCRAALSGENAEQLQ
jgi:hypothetical protein